MLRKPVNLLDIPQRHTNPGRSWAPRLARGHTVPSDVVQFFSETEKGRIYNEWIEAGRPHNLVCSECRNPDVLMHCETCCRSYHAKCLPVFEAALSSGCFYCPSCKAKQWDHIPPQFTSATNSRGSTPSVIGASSHEPVNAQMTSSTMGPAHSVIRSASKRSSPGAMDSQQSHVPGDCHESSSSDILSRARQFLVQYGQFPARQAFEPELLLQLGSMMSELETHRSLQRENQELREENENLRKNNVNTTRYFQSRTPAVSSNILPAPPTPSLDTSEKTWDRMVLDFL